MSKISPQNFFEIFLEELKYSPTMREYYKFHSDKRRFVFRKKYFLNRLEYISRHVGDSSNTIWDIGCGYGTTAIFLVLNGYTVHGTTLESYFVHIKERRRFWSKYGDLSAFTVSYENLFDEIRDREQYDRIIVQDTLHHIEPIRDGLRLIRNSLKPNGKIIVIEENGNNIIQRSMLYLRRGSKRVINIYDEVLKKEILIGNENIRSFKTWKSLFTQTNCIVEDFEYIRFFLPFVWNMIPNDLVSRIERSLSKNTILREYFYFGINILVGVSDIPLKNIK